MYRTEDDPENDQVDGSHYKNFAIQPARFLHFNNIPFLEGEIIKRLVCWRYPTSDGITELMKARHEIELLIKYAKEE